MKQTGDFQVPKCYEPVLIWPNFFYTQQKDFINSDAWSTWFIAGNGTGKTLILYWSATAIMVGIHSWCRIKEVTPPIKIKVLVPHFDYVAETALDKLLNPQRIVSPKGVLDVGPLLSNDMIAEHYSKDKRRILLKDDFGGSSIWFVTCEQGWRAARGAEADVLMADEEPEIERVFDEHVRGLRNAKGGGKIVAGLTPPYEPGKGPTWTKEKVLEADDPDVAVFNACMADNPAVTKEYIKRFSQGKTREQIDVQIYGKYPSWGDLVHPDFQDRKWNHSQVDGHILPNDTPMPENWAVDWVMAFDWHPSKPCAAVFGFLDTDGNLVIFDELDKDVAKGKDIDDLADIFRNIEGFPGQKRAFRRWQDPSAKSQYNAVHRGFNAWDAFRKAGIVTSAGKNRDPHIGIDIVNQYFRGNGKDHPRIFIYERCKNLRRYLTNHWYKRGEDGIGKPDPKWSDYPICVRYILQDVGWKEKNKHKRKSWPLQSFKPRDDGREIIDLTKTKFARYV